MANLLLSRTLSRQREIAVRTALGANLWRIIRQLLSECGLLSLAGGMAGVLLAYWGTQLVIQFSAGSIPRIDMVRIDWSVLLFSLAVALGTGLVFGLAPAWQCSKTDLNQTLKEGASRASSGLPHQRLRSSFTVAQIALALMLLIAPACSCAAFTGCSAWSQVLTPPNF